MKKLLFLSVLFIFSLAFLTNCGLSTNPEDNGLPTMEEVIKKMPQNPIFKSYSTTTQRKILRFYSEEKKFFYENINSIYTKHNVTNYFTMKKMLREKIGDQKYNQIMSKYALKYFNTSFKPGVEFGLTSALSCYWEILVTTATSN